jgi:uncharacterized protein (TIGR02145 family)
MEYPKIIKIGRSIILIIFLLVGCKKDEIQLPVLTTNDITQITQTTASSGGVIISEGNSSILVRGVCWSTSIEPTIDDFKSLDGLGIGGFTSSITALIPKTTYFVRAYATTKLGTSYGTAKSLTTEPATIPVVNTEAVSAITQTTATCGGNISTDGASTLIARGVCWSATQNPSINDNKTTDGMTVGIFSSNLTGLVGNTTYYLRAYATNNIGTAYGSQVSFKTSPLMPTVTSFSLASFSATSCYTKLTINSDGGSNVMAKGVCYGINPNPNITADKTIDGTGTESFISNISGLLTNTTYYLRAYVTNAVGTVYSNEVSFKTLEPIIDIEGNTYNITSIGNQIWLASNLKTTKLNDGTSIPNVTDGTTWSNLITPGYCWYNNDAFTYKADYGGLYNWYTVNTGKLCPQGWHVPSDTEWTTLTTFLGGEIVSGGKLKETGLTHWNTPNSGATNETGFNAIPGGICAGGGAFYNIGGIVVFWSSTEFSTNYAVLRNIYYHYSNVNRETTERRVGLSVRCLKD